MSEFDLITGKDTLEKDEAKFNRDLYDKYSSGDRQQWAEQAKKNVEFVNNLQIEEEDAKVLEARNQPVLPRNKITPAIELLIAQQTENMPRFSGFPVEDSDVEEAGDISDLMEHIWTESQGRYQIKRGIKDSKHTGIGAWLVYTDKNADWGKGEIYFKEIDPFTLYIDPNSKQPDTEDAAHKLIVEIITGEESQRRGYNVDLSDAKEEKDDRPLATLRAEENQILDVDDYTHKKFRAIDRYSKVWVDHHHVVDPFSNYEELLTEEQYEVYKRKKVVILQMEGHQPRYVTDELKVLQLFQDSERIGTDIFMVDIQGNAVPVQYDEAGNPLGPLVNLVFTTTEELISEQKIREKIVKVPRIKRVLSIADKLVGVWTLPIDRYPIITLMGHHNRNPFPLADVQFVIPYQKQLNKIASLAVAYLTNITNLKYFVTDDELKRELDERGGAAGMQVFKFDPEAQNPPFVIQHQQMPVAFFTEIQSLALEIQAFLGAYSFQDGDASNAPNTVGGIQRIDEFGQRRSRSQRDDLEQAVNNIAKIVGQYIPHTYRKRKVVRILEPYMKPRVTVYNDLQEERLVNDLTLTKYDVRMISGSMLPTNRAQRFEALKDMYMGGMLTDPTPAIVALGLPNTEDILAREDRLKQYEKIIGNMQKEMKELEGDLQTADREVRNSKMQTVIAKFKAELEGVMADVKSEAKIAKSNIKKADTSKETRTEKNNGSNKTN